MPCGTACNDNKSKTVTLAASLVSRIKKRCEKKDTKRKERRKRREKERKKRWVTQPIIVGEVAQQKGQRAQEEKKKSSGLSFTPTSWQPYPRRWAGASFSGTSASPPKSRFTTQSPRNHTEAPVSPGPSDADSRYGNECEASIVTTTMYYDYYYYFSYYHHDYY